MFQIHLNRKGMSQRAVRCEVLTFSQVDAAEKMAASDIKETTTNAEFNSQVVRIGMEMMIKSVSEPTKEPGVAKWTDVTPAELHLNWGKYFNAKDSAMLRAIHAQEHTVTKEDLDAITSGKVELAPEG